MNDGNKIIPITTEVGTRRNDLKARMRRAMLQMRLKMEITDTVRKAINRKMRTYRRGVIMMVIILVGTMFYTGNTFYTAVKKARASVPAGCPNTQTLRGEVSIFSNREVVVFGDAGAIVDCKYQYN